MPSDRNRILELALESLENKKKQLDAEIAEITRELRGGAVKQDRSATPGSGNCFFKKATAIFKGRKTAKISENEGILGKLAQEEKPQQ